MDRICGRRDFLRLAGAAGGAVFVSALPGWAGARDEDFFFVQLSDSHWGFEGPPNPDARGTLPRAVAAVNALPRPPDFIMFTGDLTHTTDDPAERRRRMREFQSMIAPLKAGTVRLMPGEHDASLDAGEAYRELFGATHYTFDHKGVHFIVLDNVSDPAGQVGDAQRAWLAQDLARQPRDARIVVFTHRPLFDLYPQWDWATRDGAQVVDLLMPYRNVTVFYGHIHQEHHHMTGHIAHHAARSLMFPLPAPGSQPRRAPLAWDAARPYQGLGWREVAAMRMPVGYRLAERAIDPPPARQGEAADDGAGDGVGDGAAPRVIPVRARRFVFTPDRIALRAGESVVLELIAEDAVMGFSAPDFGVRADMPPGKTVRLPLTARAAGTYTFVCDIFCGSGHESMGGTIEVT